MSTPTPAGLEWTEWTGLGWLSAPNLSPKCLAGSPCPCLCLCPCPCPCPVAIWSGVRVLAWVEMACGRSCSRTGEAWQSGLFNGPSIQSRQQKEDSDRGHRRRNDCCGWRSVLEFFRPRSRNGSGIPCDLYSTITNGKNILGRHPTTFLLDTARSANCGGAEDMQPSLIGSGRLSLR